MPTKPFAILQGENPYADSEDPDYFRGYFDTQAEAVLRCEELLDLDFRRIEAVICDAQLCYHDLSSFLFIYYSSPRIFNQGSVPEPLPYSSSDSYRRRKRDLVRRLALPRFHLGDRVRYVGSRDSPWWFHAGNVSGSSFLDSGIYPDHPEEEPIHVRFDYDGAVRSFPANQLCRQLDETNEACSRERDRKLAQLAQRLRSRYATTA